MAHVTFVHDIGNKPAPDVLLEQWRVALLDAAIGLLDAAVPRTSGDILETGSGPKEKSGR